jgi:putative transposase
VSLLVAIAVNSEGYREILGICEGAKEDEWQAGVQAMINRVNPAKRSVSWKR